VRSSGGSGRGGRRPDGLAGQDRLPGGKRDRDQDGQQSDQLHRRLALLIADPGHARTFAGIV
jgi:hypothetical protein